MKKVLITLLCVFIVSSIYSQSAEGRYSSLLTQDGVLFFVNPQKLKDLSGVKRFSFDVTMLSWTDSVTINYTFESDLMDIPENLTIICGDSILRGTSYSPLFVDIKGDHYEIRMTSKFGLNQIQTMVGSVNSPKFCFTQGQVVRCAQYKDKAWLRDKKKLSDILQIFNLSR